LRVGFQKIPDEKGRSKAALMFMTIGGAAAYLVEAKSG
jgi:hypothetical protein